jgi:hypothetical protein
MILLKKKGLGWSITEAVLLLHETPW